VFPRRLRCGLALAGMPHRLDRDRPDWMRLGLGQRRLRLTAGAPGKPCRGRERANTQAAHPSATNPAALSWVHQLHRFPNPQGAKRALHLPTDRRESALSGRRRQRKLSDRRTAARCPSSDAGQPTTASLGRLRVEWPASCATGTDTSEASRRPKALSAAPKTRYLASLSATPRARLTVNGSRQGPERRTWCSTPPRSQTAGSLQGRASTQRPVFAADPKDPQPPLPQPLSASCGKHPWRESLPCEAYLRLTPTGIARACGAGGLRGATMGAVAG